MVVLGKRKVDRNFILSSLKKIRSLFSYVTDCPDMLLKDIEIIVPSRYMVFPCDIIDLRKFLIQEEIVSFNPILLFSHIFAEKYLKDYSLFLILDSEKIDTNNSRYGGLQLNFCEKLDITKLITRIIVNEPSACGSFDTVKNLIKEFGLGVECLISNSIPGISSPNKRLSYNITPKTAQRITGKSDLSLTPKEKNIFDFLRRVKKDYNLNIQMRVVGGWVRDKLLGKESDDIDIAIDMPGYDFAKIVAEAAVKYNITKNPKAYRVSLEKSADLNEKILDDKLMVGAVNLFGQKIEFVPMRTEHYPDPNSRQPEITTTNSPEEDSKRRDLTFNALYYNIDTGKIDDFVGGVKDLGLEDGKMILRTPDEPYKTFYEDPLRLLRVLRFHSRFPNSVIDPSIIKAMQDPSIHESYTKKVAPERTGPEIMKMLAGEDPVSSLKLLFESGLYKTVFKVPSMGTIDEQGIQMEQQTPWHKYNLMQHTLEVVKNLNKIMKDNRETDYMRGLMNIAAVFHDFGKMQGGIQQPHPKNKEQMQYIGHEKESTKMADQIMKSIGVGKDDRDIVNQVIRLHMRPLDADKWGPKGRGKFLRDTRMHGKDEEHKDLWKYVFYHAQADSMSSQPDKFNIEENQKTFSDFRNFVESPTGSFRGTVLNGNDIINIFPQLKPSSGYIKEVLDYIKELQDTNKIDVSKDISIAKQQAVEAVQQIAPQIINKYKETTMGSNCFKKVKISQVAPLSGEIIIEDPEIKKGPDVVIPKYRVDMRVRDRRKSVAQPQQFGKVESIKGNKIKIVWNPGDKEKRREEIFDMVENTEILSLIIEEI